MSMATKLGRVMTNLEGLPPLKLHDPLMTWSRKITWQIKKYHLQKTHRYQTRQCADLPWTMWSRWGHVANWNFFILTFTRLMATSADFKEEVQNATLKSSLEILRDSFVSGPHKIKSSSTFVPIMPLCNASENTSLWTQDVNWTYIRRSEDVQDKSHSRP